MKKYFINGWSEREGYFFSHGFSAEEIERLEAGETICKDGNEYRIEIKQL